MACEKNVSFCNSCKAERAKLCNVHFEEDLKGLLTCRVMRYTGIKLKHAFTPLAPDEGLRGQAISNFVFIYRAPGRPN